MCLDPDTVLKIMDPDPICPESLDPDPVCIERLDPDPVYPESLDPVTITPDPQPCSLPSSFLYI